MHRVLAVWRSKGERCLIPSERRAGIIPGVEVEQAMGSKEAAVTSSLDTFICSETCTFEAVTCLPE